MKSGSSYDICEEISMIQILHITKHVRFFAFSHSIVWALFASDIFKN